tara:strand:+ start:36 stop:1466 length:1431 start_codon:yes stop_codon:yes gene_type:complete
MKIINSLFSSLIIVPAFLLGRMFLPKNKALMGAALVGILPSHFVLSPLLLSENIFYTLFLFSFYFTYRALTRPKSINFIISSILIALSFLSRPTAIAFLPAFFLTFGYFWYKQKLKLHQLIIWCLVFLSVTLPWFIRNMLIFGISLRGMFGSVYVSDVSSGSALSWTAQFVTINWMFIYLGVLIIGGLIILPVYAWSYIKSRGWLSPLGLWSISTFFFFIFIAAMHGASSPITIPNTVLGRILHTRHIDALLPLIIIFGLSGLHNRIKLNKFIIFFSIMISIFSISQLLYFNQRLFAPNNASLFFLGMFKLVLDAIVSNRFVPLNFSLIPSLIIIISIIIVSGLVWRLRKHTVSIFLIFCVCFSLLGSALIIYNANQFWHPTDHTRMGHWLSARTTPQSSIIYDKDVCVPLISKQNQTGLCQTNLFIPSAFWLNANVRLGSEHDVQNNDFFITTKPNSLYPLKSSFGTFKIYQKTN